MVDQPTTIPRSFMTDMPTATINLGLSLLSRRSNAIADFWRSCAEVRQPTELMAVQLNYWTHLIDDYQEAISASVGAITAGEAAAEAAQSSGAAPAAQSA